jgi:hypothetical protein
MTLPLTITNIVSLVGKDAFKIPSDNSVSYGSWQLMRKTGDLNDASKLENIHEAEASKMSFDKSF